MEQCPRCGKELDAAAAAEGLCAACLLELALEREGEASREPGPSGVATLPLDDAALRLYPPIGPYRLLGILGEGGMGIVYVAEQERPIRRRVALKLIKIGMDSREVLARFEAERQALALMDHPNVARVLDAGTTADGRPFFVMEYIEGLPLTEYCDRNRLGTSDRLRLFAEVCRAVHHAHQRGIIHRDIKPSNLLVKIEDGRPVPKVIDFGIAKALHQRLTERTLFTALGQVVGTPAYMSPEQAEMSSGDVDTTTDVYSLGVVAYELLTGALPFDPVRLRQAAFGEMMRILREEEPSKPSTRLSSLGAAATDVAHKRRREPRELERELRGDLDWIVLKALDKDRTQRYQSATELAADVERHLRNEAVLAGRPSVAYRSRKFVRRHRLGVAIASTFVLLVAASAVVAGVLYVQAERARRQTRRQLVDVWVRSGIEAAGGGDLGGALPWLVGALRLEQDETRVDAHRHRIASVLDRSARVARLWRHQGPVLDARFNQDGSAVVTASEDGTARVWSVASGGPVTPPLRHEGWVLGASFAPAGDRVVTWSLDGHARVWSAADGRLVAALPHGGSQEVVEAVFSTTGDRILTGAWDGAVRLWDASSGAPLWESAQPYPVVDIDLSPDGRAAAAAYADGGVRILDAATGEELGPPPHHAASGVYSLSFGPGGDRIATGSGDSTARIWSVRSGAPVSEPLEQGSIVMGVEMSPDGRWLVTLSVDRKLRLYDARNGLAVHEAHVHGSMCRRTHFTRDGRYVLVACDDGAAVRLSTADWRPAGAALRHGAGVTAARPDPSGRFVLTASRDGTARVWDLASSVSPFPVMEHNHRLRDAAFSTDGALVVGLSSRGAGTSGYVRVWDARTAQPVTPPLSIPGPVPPQTVSLDASGSRLVIGGRDRVRVWSLETGEPSLERRLEDGFEVLSASLSPDGELLAIGAGRFQYPSASFTELGPGEGYTALVRTSSGEQVGELLRHPGAVVGTRFNRDGSSLWSAGHRGARLWSTVSATPAGGPLLESMSLATVKVSPIDPDLLLLAGRDGAVLTSLEPVLAPRTLAREPVYRDAAHFSPDGSRLITGTQSGRVEVWDAASGTGLGLLTGHGTLVYSASFHPAGRWGITSSRDGTVRLWDTAAAQPLISAGVHAEVVWAASFAPDGSRYLAASQDGAIRLFPFAAETAAITDLEDAALVLSGVRRDLSGSAAPATAEELEQAFERLHRSPLLRPLAAGATAAAWHREEARTAARERRWDAAERHLGEVIRVDESRWMDHAARGRALAELGRYEAGAAELELAARTHREADLLADLARLRLARGDVEGYRRLRSELLERFGATRNPDRAARVTRAALLVEPAGGLEAQRLVELARLRLETEGAHAEALETLAAALLRAEESQAALRAFDEAAVARQGGESSWSAAFRSLAHRQRGNGRGAEEWRRRAAVLGGETWQERLEGELLGRTLGDR